MKYVVTTLSFVYDSALLKMCVTANKTFFFKQKETIKMQLIITPYIIEYKYSVGA